MTPKALKYYQEQAKLRGKILLIESFSISDKRVSLPESRDLDNYKKIRFTESEKTKYKSPIGIVRDIEVTKFTENLNGRKYPRKLWEKIYENKTGERTYCLADHPEGEGSVSKIVGVWHNFRLTEDRGIADLYLIGEDGERFFDALEAGGKCGISTVGYGELEEDEKTVVWDSYELARLGDWVMDPSQQVYAEADNILYDDTDEEEESSLKEKTIQSISESNTNKIAKEVYTMSQVTAVLGPEARHFRNDVKRTFKEALNNPNYMEAKSRIQETLEEVPETPEYADIRQKGLVALSEVETKLKSSLSSKEKMLKEQKSTIEQLQERYNVASNVLNELKTKVRVLNEQYAKKDKELSEANTQVDEYKKVRPMMERDLKLFEGKVKLYEKEVSVLTKKLQLHQINEKKMLADINAAKQNFTLMEADLAQFKEQHKKFKELKENVKTLVTHSNNMYHDIKCFVEDRKILKQNMKDLLSDRLNFIRDMKEAIKDNRALKADNMYLKNLLENKKKRNESTGDLSAQEDDDSEIISAGENPVPYQPPVEMDTTPEEQPYDMSVLDPDREDSNFVDDDTSFSAEGQQASVDVDSLPLDPESEEEEGEPQLDPDIYGFGESTEEVGGDEEKPYAGLDSEESSEFDNFQQSGDGKYGNIKDPALSRQMNDSGAYKSLEVAEKTKKDIKNTYILESKKTPSLRAVEKSILASKTLKEAKEKISIFREAKAGSDKPFRMTEKVQKPTFASKDDDWLRGRD